MSEPSIFVFQFFEIKFLAQLYGYELKIVNHLFLCLQVFFMIPLLVELKVVPAVKAIVRSQLAIAENIEFDFEDNLIIIRNCIEEMTSQLSQLHKINSQ